MSHPTTRYRVDIEYMDGKKESVDCQTITSDAGSILLDKKSYLLANTRKLVQTLLIACHGCQTQCMPREITRCSEDRHNLCKKCMKGHKEDCDEMNREYEEYLETVKSKGE